MNLLTFITYFAITILNISAINCLANPLQKSELPKEMPTETEIRFNQNGGMAPTYKKIKVSGNLLFVEERTFQNRTPQMRYVEIPNEEKSALYQVFVENKFDLIKNDKREGIVYDAPWQNISIRADRKSFNTSAGANSPLSGINLARYQAVKNAIFKLEEKFKNQLVEVKQNYAVIKYNPEFHSFIFKNVRPEDLYDVEFAQIDNFITKAVADFNSKQKDNRQIKDLSNYKFQYVTFYNENREKIVWVNAFCDDFGKNWRNEIIFVKDGGSCFFNFKINLSKREYFDFQVNGVA